MVGEKLPGGALARRPLHFFWICDVSGSMAESGKIESLNAVIKEVIPEMRKVASENPNAEILVRVLTFSHGASWVIEKPTPVDNFNWYDLLADGQTDMGEAFSKISDELRSPPMTNRALPPVLVLLSDGAPTDTYADGLKKLLGEPWGKKSVRIAIAIGDDAKLDVLQEFIANSERKPLTAKNPTALLKLIKWASTEVLKAASAPPSQAPGTTANANVVVPSPPDVSKINNADDVW